MYDIEKIKYYDGKECSEKEGYFYSLTPEDDCYHDSGVMSPRSTEDCGGDWDFWCGPYDSEAEAAAAARYNGDWGETTP